MLRISIASFCAFLFILVFNGTNNERDNRRIISDHHYINGDVIGSKPNPIITGPIVNWDGPERTTFQSDNSASITVTTFEIDPTKRTIYDYQSNGMVQHIAQDPNNSSNLFAVFMTSMETSSYGDRRTQVFQSTDAGNTWIFVSECPNGIRSGFPSIDILSDGSEIIATHTTDGGAILNSMVYPDIAPGAGSFTRLTPDFPNGSDNPVWPKISVTSNVTNTRKFVIVASELTNDSTYTNAGNSLSTSSYSGWQLHTDIINAEAYAIARASNGKIGIVYEGDGAHDAADIGDIYLIESTDDGLTWGTRTQIWNCNFSTDSIGVFKSVSLVYNGTTPNVVMGLCLRTPAQEFTLNAKTSTRFWSPGINGGVPVMVDTCTLMSGSNPENDNMTSTCRGVIGRSADGNALYIAWARARSDTSATGNNFFDIYFTYSSDNGATWTGRTKITNNSGPLRDCRYPSISQSNHVSAPNHFAHLTYQLDSIAGSQVQGADPSPARFMYAKVTIDDPIGIHTIGSEIPKTYILHQNFPNPFNPETKIRFDLPKQESVTLKVYNAMGQLIAVLADNEVTGAGAKEVNFNANGLASGIYFYTIKAGDFTQTKKMILLK